MTSDYIFDWVFSPIIIKDHTTTFIVFASTFYSLGEGICYILAFFGDIADTTSWITDWPSTTTNMFKCESLLSSLVSFSVAKLSWDEMYKTLKLKGWIESNKNSLCKIANDSKFESRN